MKTIWKFQFAIADSFSIKIPHAAKILSVQMQDGIPCIWALVNPDNIIENRRFHLYGTGHQFELDDFKFIGTFQQGQFVWHLFENS